MLRRAVFLSIVFVLLSPTVAPAGFGDRYAPAPFPAPARRRVTIIALDDSTIREWMQRPALAALVRSGASALLSTRTGEDADVEEELARAAVYATLGSGQRTNGKGPAGTLSDAIMRAGGTFSAHAPLACTPIAECVGVEQLLSEQPRVGTGGPDVALYEYFRPEKSDQQVEALSASQKPQDVLIVVSPTTSFERARRRVFLGAIVIKGAGFQNGLLRSPSTRRDGIVTLADIAPTILTIAGIKAPASMTGRAVTLVPTRESATTLLRLDRELVHASHVRSHLLRGFLIVAMILLGLSSLTSKLASRRFATRALTAAIVALCSIPLALVLEPLVHSTSMTGSVVWVVVVSIAAGVIATVTLGASRGLPVVCAITALVVLVDLALGGPLAMRSPLSYLIAEGSRFYGIGNELMGVLVGALLVSTAAGYEEFGALRAAQLTGAIVLTAAVYLMAAPHFGAKFGSILVAIPALGILAARAGGRRLTAGLAVVLEVVAAAITGLVVLVDRLRPAVERSHIGSSVAAGTARRKISAALRLLAFSIWMVTLLVFVAEGIVVFQRRRDDVRRLLEDHLFVQASLQSGAFAIVGAILFNDAGVIAATFIAVQLFSAILLRLMELDVTGETQPS
ncbi:MAG: hypothetical protein ABR548_14145 [Actinomycetota bacterium]|nr:hypothetical protein [Actinomycetota bacterium]